MAKIKRPGYPKMWARLSKAAVGRFKSQKIYVVYEENEDFGAEIIGAYSTNEKAEKARIEAGQEADDEVIITIEEVELE